MSLAHLPRLHFKGRFFTDVCTTNNDDISQIIDPVAVKVRFGENAARPDSPVDRIPTEDSAFDTWARSFNSDRRIRSSWNHYGSNDCGFLDCKIVSVDTGDGPVTNDAIHPVIGAAVTLGNNPSKGEFGVMVDLQPEGTWGTLIFADRFRVLGGGQGLFGPPTIACSRWLHFGRNPSQGGFSTAAATWQCVIPREDLKINPGTTGVLVDLHDAAQAHGGIVVRYCTYLLTTTMTTQELAVQYKLGESPSNPAVGVVVGSIGVWDQSELVSMPAGRLLLPTQSLLWDEQSLLWDQIEAVYGPVTVQIDPARNRAVLDLITAVPETDRQGTKVNLGAAIMVALPDDNSPAVELGRFSYSKADYDAGGGLQEISLTEEQTALALRSRLGLSFGSNIIHEERDLVVDTDERNLHFDVGEEKIVRLHVTRRGAAPTAPVTVQLRQYFNPSGKSSSGPIPNTERALSHPDSVVTDAQGYAEFTVKALRPMLGFVHVSIDSFNEEPTPEYGCLVNFRALPADDYSHLHEDAITFALVYEEVLRYYHLVYPVMRKHLALNDEEALTASAEAMLERIDAEAWKSWKYMPRTREMSAGKRKLLRRWLLKVAPHLA